MKAVAPLLALLLLSAAPNAFAQAPAQNPVELWKDYDPDKGDFKEEIVREGTTNGVYSRESYISAYILGEEVRVYCLYSVKAGATNAPALLNVHGWMGAPSLAPDYIADGWAVMSYDYCGKKDPRPHYTKYPEKLDHGRMEAKTIHAKLPDGKDITDPKQTSHYLWFAIERRVLSYLIAQKEVDKSRIGARGYSYGGTMMWNLGMDPRVKAIVAYFGIGWITYYRDRGVWMYNNPLIEPPMSPGEKIVLATVEAQSHAPYITAPTLWLTGSNDHHSGHERSGETFKMFQSSVPWSFAVQARGRHNTEKLGDNTKLWLEKYVLKKDIAWPKRPASKITLDKDGVPQITVTPDSPETVKDLQIFYTQKEPNNVSRTWRDARISREGNTWTAKLPVLNINDYVFAFANAAYTNNIVLTSDFNAAIPAKLGNAIATDKPSDILPWDNNEWTDSEPAQGPGGIKGIKAANNKVGIRNVQMSDPAWKAKPSSSLAIRFHSPQPLKCFLSVNDQFDLSLELKGGDDWQTLVIPAKQFINRKTSQPMTDWSKTSDLLIMPAKAAENDLTKAVFSEFKWVEAQP